MVIRIHAASAGAGTAHRPLAGGGAARAGADAGKREGPATDEDSRPQSPKPAIGDGEGLVEHIQGLRRYANVLVGNHADADDLVQETLKRALTYLERDRRIENLRAYLFTILHNARKDALKKQARRGTQVPIEDAPLVSNEASPSDRIACNQVVQAMHRLSEEHRQVLLLVGVEGMSYREASAILGLPLGTVMSRLNRARAALREALELGGPIEVDRPL